MTNSADVIRRGYLDHAAGQLHYHYCGRAASPLLLLLHQTPSSSAMYLRLMPLLSQQFFVVAVDTPGFGNSDRLPGAVSIAAFADAIYQSVSAHFDRPALVFGHHTGAAIAVQLAFDHPEFVRALALSGPTLLTDAQKQALPSAAGTVPVDPEGAHWQVMWQRLRAKDPEAELALSQRETLLAFACGEYYQASYRAVVEQDVATQLAAIDCPALVFAGGRDLLRSAVAPTVRLLQRGMAAALPEEAGTYVCERQPAAVADLLRRFFLEVVETD
ncbi:alpha/beta fold hydrolase [Microbulbifer sp. SA54]|uniref:alpha/beta fold hydrolase n=1 Tax=Microbulbifer sp. SA54 TaxID=3401577 RepID=UPI003AAEA5D2